MLNRRRMMLMNGQEEDDNMKEWKLINKVTLESDSREITVDVDNNGQPFELSDFAMNIAAMSDSTSNQSAHVFINTHMRCLNAFSVPKNASSIPAYSQALVWNCGPVIMSAGASGAAGSRANVITCCQPEYLNFETIQKVTVQVASANAKFAAGATLTLYGR